jgi:chromosome partitioning protein
MADTLVTPINDSFLDFDVLGTVDPATYSVTGESHYAEMVRDSWRKRRQLDGTNCDWIVVRNRLSMPGSPTTCRSGSASARSTASRSGWFTASSFRAG